MASMGKIWSSSHSMTCGAISASANSRTDLRSWICSGVYSKSMVGWAGLNDFLSCGVPPHGPLPAIAFDGHAAGDRNAKAQLERTIGLMSRADRIQEISHVRVGRGGRRSEYLRAIRAVDLLRQITDLLALGDGSVRSQHLFGVAEPIVAETRIP